MQQTGPAVETKEYFKMQTIFSYLLKNDETPFPNDTRFGAKNDKFVRTALQSGCNAPSPHEDSRSQKRPHKMNEKLIQEHIESFNPEISHYRREHLPKFRYLPNDLSIVTIHKDSFSIEGNFQCSYDKYRCMLKARHISSANLGYDECENCEEVKLHDPEYTKENIHENCMTCVIHARSGRSIKEDIQRHENNTKKMSKENYYE